MYIKRKQIASMPTVGAVSDTWNVEDKTKNAPSLRLLKEALLDYAHPIGSLYASENSTDPGTLFGGTWTRIKDKFILAAGDNYAPGTSGGSASNTHNHYQTVSFDGAGFYATTCNMPPRTRIVQSISRGFTALTETTAAARQDSTYNETIDIMPPYEAFYVWKRVS